MAYWQEYCKKLGDNDFIRIRCSDCGKDAPQQREVLECPNCKAKMDVDCMIFDPITLRFKK